MLRSTKVLSTSIAAAALLVSGVAFADSNAPKECKADVKKLCPKVKPGHGAVLVCLEQNADKVSLACQGSLTDKAQAIEGACKPELDKFCATVEHGQGRLLQCLAQHEADMGADCKAFWGAAKGKAKSAAK
jgi:hypothetical protein